MSTVTIIDYGMCNLLNVVRAFEHCGAAVQVAETPGDAIRSERLVVPGVGAFPDCVNELRQRGLDDSIRRFVATQRPLLGICIGMQVLFDRSEEFGDSAGLGILAGAVQEVPSSTVAGVPHRIPHIGWSHLRLPEGRESWEHTILRGLGVSPAVYFVHSFTAYPTDPRDRLADTWYGGRRISAAVQRGNVVGVQFHPEKSGRTGLAVIRNFLAG